MTDIRRLEVAELVDYCSEYNRAYEEAPEKDRVKKIKATQGHWDSLMG